MRPRSLPVLLLGLAALASAAPAPAGRLAYLKGGAAWVEPASGGAPTRLPRSEGALLLALSPTDGTAAYYVGPLLPGPGGGSALLRGFVSRSPYRSAAPLPGGLERAPAGWFSWGATGRELYVGGDRGPIAAYRPVTGKAEPGAEPYGPTSRSGEVAARLTDEGLDLVGPGARPERFVFTPGRPEPLLNALRAQVARPGIREFLASSAELRRNRLNWATSEPAVSPDGEAVYFASNLGTGMGASGNTTFVVFKADTAETRVVALGRLGPMFGRVPELQVSPDGRKLLVATSRHSSAVENPVSLYAVDLVTQKAVELVMSDPLARGKTSLVDGFCWLADSRSVAVSAVYYSTDDAINKPDFELRDADYTLFVKDAVTGKTLRRVAGARSPSCSLGR